MFLLPCQEEKGAPGRGWLTVRVDHDGNLLPEVLSNSELLTACVFPHLLRWMGLAGPQSQVQRGKAPESCWRGRGLGFLLQGLPATCLHLHKSAYVFTGPASQPLVVFRSGSYNCFAVGRQGIFSLGLLSCLSSPLHLDLQGREQRRRKDGTKRTQPLPPNPLCWQRLS